MRRLSILAISAAAIFAVGCGDGGDGGESGPANTAEAQGSGDAMKRAEGDAIKQSASGGESATVANRSARRGKRIKAVGSSYGRVIADRRGEAFYLFGKERGGKSRCYGACARAWPPVLTKGKPQAGKGIKARLLGATKRRNGKRQATYRGHPLYYYQHDSPGTILCQDVSQFGGLWLLVKPNGNPVS